MSERTPWMPRSRASERSLRSHRHVRHRDSPGAAPSTACATVREICRSMLPPSCACGRRAGAARRRREEGEAARSAPNASSARSSMGVERLGRGDARSAGSRRGRARERRFLLGRSRNAGRGPVTPDRRADVECRGRVAGCLSRELHRGRAADESAGFRRGGSCRRAGHAGRARNRRVVDEAAVARAETSSKRRSSPRRKNRACRRESESSSTWRSAVAGATRSRARAGELSMKLGPWGRDLEPQRRRLGGSHAQSLDGQP